MLYGASDILRVRYNVPSPTNDAVGGEGVSYVQTHADVSALSCAEGEDAQAALGTAVLEYAASHGLREVSALYEPVIDEDFARYAGWYDMFPRDRTLEVPMMDPELFNPLFVEFLQMFLRDEWPDWRIHVIVGEFVGPGPDAGDRSLDMMIYPNGICAGESRSPPDELLSVATAWQRRLRSWFAEEYGPRLRQFAFLRSVLPASVASFSSAHRYSLVAVFDNHKGDFGTQSLWILHRGDPYGIRVQGDEACGHGMQYEVDSTGVIQGRLCRRSDDCLILSEWVIPPSSSTRLRVSDSAGNELGVLRSDVGVIRDTDLCRSEGVAK